jgi:uncharacterized protein DUF1259
MSKIGTKFAALCFGSLLLGWGCNKPDEGSPAAGGAALQAAGDPSVAPVLPPLDAQTIAERLGATLSPSEDGSLRAVVPRTDVKVSVDGVSFPAAAGLGTEVVFRPGASGATLVGSVSLFQDEVSPAMDSAFAHGMAVTALHGRFFFDEPRVVSMHFVAEGNAAFLASGVQAIGSAIRDARLQSAQPRSNFSGDAPLPGELNAPALGAVFGVQASSREGLVKISVPGEPTRSRALSSEAPLLSAVFFGSDHRAAVDGGFSLSPHHVQLVLQALRRTNIHVVSVQQHGIGHDPGHSLVYFHANGTALTLAQGVHAALQARLSKGGQ